MLQPPILPPACSDSYLAALGSSHKMKLCPSYSTCYRNQTGRISARRIQSQVKSAGLDGPWLEKFDDFPLLEIQQEQGQGISRAASLNSTTSFQLSLKISGNTSPSTSLPKATKPSVWAQRIVASFHGLGE